ncbi:MAG: hypothetical protein JNL74_03700, partial [Fibrobacteres bacterium]|nr:hypothetical protein [Fibrobacterota bacterium]
MTKDRVNFTTAVCITVVWVTVFTTLAFKKYFAFNCGIDLANIFQPLYNTLHGNFMQMTFDGLDKNICRWGGHVEIIFVFI